MRSSLIGKIEKAARYAQEPDRVTFHDFTATFKGEHDCYTLSYSNEGRWNCTCHFFPGWGTCSHIMALQRLLAIQLPREALKAPPQEH
ncbi:MAG: hypothetical protein HY676_03825 [Chloroflexi bacterium]|nr:hypothetical protein [Chloroflexota bacterium]